jgi:hypothetical protein
MRSLLLSLMLLSAAASAETVTLGTTTCGTLKQCVEIPNDAALDLNLYASPAYPWVHLYIDGVSFYSPSGNGMTFTNLAFTDPVGNIVYLSATFSTYKTCVRSGRGQTCLTHWSLLGGTITR